MAITKRKIWIMNSVMLFTLGVYALGQTELGRNNMDDPPVLWDFWLIIVFYVLFYVLVWYEKRSESSSS